MPETSYRRPTWNADIVARKASEKVSVGRSKPIQINPDRARPDRETDKARITEKDQKDPEPKKPVKG